MNTHFRKIGNKSSLINTPKFGLINFRTISTDRSLEIWLGGFKDIGITPAGAKKFLSKKTTTELVDLIKSRTDLDDVLIIAKLSKTASVKKSKKEMIEILAPESEAVEVEKTPSNKEESGSGSGK